MDEQAVIAAQDEQRTKRLFLSFVSNLVGVSDQSYVGQDGYAYNAPRQYQTIGQGGAVGIEGTSISNRQQNFGGMSISMPMLLVLGVGAYLLLQKN